MSLKSKFRAQAIQKKKVQIAISPNKDMKKPKTLLSMRKRLSKHCLKIPTKAPNFQVSKIKGGGEGGV